MKEESADFKIWEIPIGRLIPLLRTMKEELTEHFKEGGRVKAVNPDGFPSQELLPNITFDRYRD